MYFTKRSCSLIVYQVLNYYFFPGYFLAFCLMFPAIPFIHACVCIQSFGNRRCRPPPSSVHGLSTIQFLSFFQRISPAGGNVGTIQGREARQGLRAAADTAVLMLLRLLVSRAALRRWSDAAAASQSGFPDAA